MTEKNLTIEYATYMEFRNMGFRAIMAYGIAKYGMSFVIDSMMDARQQALDSLIDYAINPYGDSGKFVVVKGPKE